MSIHRAVFWSCAFFLVGIGCASSVQLVWLVAVPAVLIPLILKLRSKNALALCACGVAVGALYFFVWDWTLQNAALMPHGSEGFSGDVVSVHKSHAGQSAVLALEAPYHGNVQLALQRYPELAYGDRVEVRGTAEILEGRAASIARKNSVMGIVRFPRISMLEHNKGSSIIAFLFNAKDRATMIFRKLLPSDHASLVAGITLGNREYFDSALEEAMRRSGTTHLVALSGYNIMVVSWVVNALFERLIARRMAFWASTAAIILFVVMTGGQASVVRAALMGIVALLASHVERLYSFRNAAAIAAAGMVAANPYILVFDVGFQLSFAALLGIVYVAPAIKKLLNIQDGGVFNWKENLVLTCGAQVAALPLLLFYFGQFSFTSVAANILITLAVPWTMGLGFIAISVGFVSMFVATIIAFPLYMLLSYELLLIRFFSAVAAPLHITSFGVTAVCVSYGVLIGGLAYMYGKYKDFRK